MSSVANGMQAMTTKIKEINKQKFKYMQRQRHRHTNFDLAVFIFVDFTFVDDGFFADGAMYKAYMNAAIYRQFNGHVRFFFCSITKYERRLACSCPLSCIFFRLEKSCKKLNFEKKSL